MIVGSSILAGAEVEYCARAMTSTLPLALQVLQLLFFLIFLVEFLLRIGARGRKFFVAPDWAWNCFDLFVLCTSLLEIWLTFVADGASSAMMFARTVRIIRIARIIRIIRFLDHLRLLVYTVFNTVKSLIWMMVLMVILTYMFAIPLTQAATQRLLSGKENGDLESLEDLFFFFGTIPNSIFTLFMCVSGGENWIVPVTELAKLYWIYTFMFLVYQIFTNFAMLNVITGFCCENAMSAAREDKEHIVHDQIRNRQVYIRQFSALLKTFDRDDSGEITFFELEEFIHDEDVQAYFASLSMSVDSAWDIFRLLDKDDSGRISTEEFISGCLSLKGFAKTIDVVKISQDLERQNKVLSHRVGQNSV
ncbi:unnamed protein product [Polarella glacialis]|uniref:EF-hand domain-containing protein n=1 Tax=Polarella glacialis TaxID=89957 RepID=A0A813JFU5_POLGL|nr:unnamed protein product [Polarella glacialis]